MKKKGLILLLLTLVIGGCSSSNLNITKINERQLTGDLSSFVERIGDKNGVYLFSGTNKKQYVLLNYSTVLQGEKASYLNGFDAEIKDKILIINIDEHSTDNYEDDRLGEISVFEIINDNSFDTIQVFKNGKEIGIDLVGN